MTKIRMSLLSRLIVLLLAVSQIYAVGAAFYINMITGIGYVILLLLTASLAHLYNVQLRKEETENERPTYTQS